LYNSFNLNWQFQWMGVRLQNKWVQVCRDCMDKPSIFLRQIVLPPDPPSIYQPRTETYAIDEAGSYVPPTATQGFTRPGDAFYFVPMWSTNVVFGCIGGGSVNLASPFSGGGGGAFAGTSIAVSGGEILYFHVGAADDSSWACISVNAPPTSAAEGCLAVPATGRIGGQASACIGSTVYSGGNGSAPAYGAGGGGAAAGSSGAGGRGGIGGNVASTSGGGGGGGGANGGASAANIGAQNTGGIGGDSGTAGAGGIGGTLASLIGGAGIDGGGGGGGYGLGLNIGGGGAGGAGVEIDGLHGAGGGGGGAGASSTGPARVGGDGGLYGGGGGGGDSAPGTPASGLVYMVFT
jgi:hypothetical protein